ncbi:serine hydrolase domain-containing protein [Actinacidiphila acidipaludis]|uniref:Beta-lactamase family protein n=1 Tax=Actinacidiphila acidipaludis TaxID=2873382 RepID=A0ABS7QDB1_9ACTN|nr:serine hydrolase domain-containing protein [Streptomyces acidipaludis]MBY8881154.1 beta-lactamase family protein [Streptomyces acidipaludis]
MHENATGGVDRRSLLGWGGLAAAGAAAAATPMVGAQPAHTAPAPAGAWIPRDCLPGGAYDRYVAELAAADRFSGVVLLSHRGRTVLSRSYGMADKERGIPNHERVAFNLSSAGKPFVAVALLQLAQQGKLKLADTVGTHLTGFAEDIAEQVTIHHMLAGISGLDSPDEDLQRVFQSREEVHDYYEGWARQSRLVAPVGTPTDHAGAEIAISAMIVEAVAGTSYWDYVEEHVFRRCGMTGTAFATRPQWLTDTHIAHAYMTLADGSRVDAVRNLDKGSPHPYELGKNPARLFIAAPGDAGFATAPDLVRFAHGLSDGTLLDRPWADVFTAAKVPHGPASFGAYQVPVSIVQGQWVYSRAGGDPGGGANWNIYPDTGWVGVILGNHDDFPLVEMIERETQAVTGGR